MGDVLVENAELPGRECAQVDGVETGEIQPEAVGLEGGDRWIRREARIFVRGRVTAR